MNEVFWAEPALQDLDDIAAYIAGDNRRAAERIVRRIAEQVSGLGDHPRIGRSGRVEDTRELVIVGTPYIVVYRIRERVEIVAVYHAARIWPDSF